MQMDWNHKNKNYMILILLSVSVILFMKYLFGMTLPFLVGASVVILLNPFLLKVQRTLHIGKGMMIGILLFFTGCIPGLIFFFGAQYLFQNISAIEMTCNDMLCELDRCWDRCCMFLCSHGNFSMTEMNQFFDHGMLVVTEKMKEVILPGIMNSSMSIMKWIGIIGAAWAVLIIFCMMFAKDYEVIKEKLSKYSAYIHFYRIVKKIFHMLISYFKTQFCIMIMIFGMVSLGMAILGFRRFWLIGLIISLLEALPFIGTGITLIPMAVWQIITGDIIRAVGLIALYGICVLIREYLEPKLLGKKSGMHPIIMLITIYIGVQVYGLAGILTGPLTYLIIVETFREISQDNRA